MSLAIGWLNDRKLLSHFCAFCAVLVATVALPIHSPAAQSEAESLMNKAQAAHLRGDTPIALELANKAVEAAPANAQCYFVRGRIYVSQAEHVKAIDDFDHAVKLEPRGGELYQLRGCEHFKLGHISESIADFDKFLQFVPKQAPHHWQRGISLYYAGRYDDGRKQFELHQTVNPADVENAVWHFLCVARLDGPEKARASLIPIQGDRRVPMSQIYELFGGKATPEEVFAAAKAAGGSKTSDPLFYANLYVGLYYEALGDGKRAAEYINKAAQDFPAEHYMGDVARVHAALLKKKKPSANQ
jgi:lipoprotein NlpI